MEELRCTAVLIGPPGSGKTMLADWLAEHHGYTTVEMSRLLKQEAERDTPEARRIRPYLREGHLVPTDLVEEALSARLAGIDRFPVILDGFPRNKEQLGSLDRLEKEGLLDVASIIVLELAPEIAEKRIAGRRYCPNCDAVYHVEHDPPPRDEDCGHCGAGLEEREDDKPHVVRKRLEEYGRETQPVIAYFRGHRPMQTHFVDASEHPQKVRETVEAILRQTIPRERSQENNHE